MCNEASLKFERHANCLLCHKSFGNVGWWKTLQLAYKACYAAPTHSTREAKTDPLLSKIVTLFTNYVIKNQANRQFQMLDVLEIASKRVFERSMQQSHRSNQW